MAETPAWRVRPTDWHGQRPPRRTVKIHAPDSDAAYAAACAIYANSGCLVTDAVVEMVHGQG